MQLQGNDIGPGNKEPTKIGRESGVVAFIAGAASVETIRFQRGSCRKIQPSPLHSIDINHTSIIGEDAEFPVRVGGLGSIHGEGIPHEVGIDRIGPARDQSS